MALVRKRASKKDFTLSAGIKWTHKPGATVWNGLFEHPKYDSPIVCMIENVGKETYRWTFTTPGPDVISEAGNSEGQAFWYAADDVRAAIDKL